MAERTAVAGGIRTVATPAADLDTVVATLATGWRYCQDTAVVAVVAAAGDNRRSGQLVVMQTH